MLTFIGWIVENKIWLLITIQINMLQSIDVKNKCCPFISDMHAIEISLYVPQSEECSWWKFTHSSDVKIMCLSIFHVLICDVCERVQQLHNIEIPNSNSTQIQILGLTYWLTSGVISDPNDWVIYDVWSYIYKKKLATDDLQTTFAALLKEDLS